MVLGDEEGCLHGIGKSDTHLGRVPVRLEEKVLTEVRAVRRPISLGNVPFCVLMKKKVGVMLCTEPLPQVT